MKTKKSLIIISLVSFIPVCLWALGSNNTGYRITNIAQNITVNNVCRSVRNTGAQNYFAPTKTSTEWSNFITNKPSDVLIGSCCTPTPCKTCNASGNLVSRPNGASCTKNGKSGWCSSGQCGAYFWDVCSGYAGIVRCWKSKGNGIRAGSHYDRYCSYCPAGVNSGTDYCQVCPNIDGSGAGEWSHWRNFN